MSYLEQIQYRQNEALIHPSLFDEGIEPLERIVGFCPTVSREGFETRPIEWSLSMSCD